MKSVVFLCDGMADYPVEALGGKTPLDVSSHPNMDAIAQSGLRLSELIICGPADAQEQARWRAVPALTHRYYVLKD